MASRIPYKVLKCPLKIDFEPHPEDITRFLSFVKFENETEHWLWTGYCDPKGYGQFTFNNKKVWAHRWSYAVWKRPLPPNLTVEHVCRNPSCVNPWHLELRTNSENSAEGNRNRGTEPTPF